MNLRKFALKAGVAAALVLGGGAVALAADAQATSAVNVRNGPGTQYGIVDQLRAGEWVDVRSCSGSWCRISHSGPDGWVSANYLTRDGYYDDDFYDGPDIVVRPAPRIYPRVYPRTYPRPYYYGNYPTRPYANFCVGGQNASFCIGN